MRIFSVSKYILLFFVLLALIFTVACKDADNNSGVNGGGDNNTDNDIKGDIITATFETYIYQSQQIYSIDVQSFLQGSAVYNDRIFYWFAENAGSSPTIVIVSIAADGGDRQETRIPVSGWAVSIGGLQVTDDGSYDIIYRTYNEDGNTFIRGVYNPSGAVISSLEITSIETIDDLAAGIEQAVFDDDGNIAMIISGISQDYELHLICAEGNSLGQLQSNSNQSIIKLPDNRVVVFSQNNTGSNLREIDFDTGELSDEIKLAIPGISKISLAGINQPFDLLVDDGRMLYGYDINTRTQTLLLDWMETKLVLSLDYDLAVLSDNGIVVFHTGFMPATVSVEWLAEVFVLTPMLRSDIPEYTTLVLGGFWIGDDVRREVVAFNLENQYYQIEIRDYSEEDDYDAALNRFRIEIMTGSGPDIIQSYFGTVPKDSDFLIDLYPYIDADPQLARTDFFGNILSSMETDDGRMTFIGNKFTIQTLVMRRDAATKIEPFTFTSILNRLEETPGLRLFADWMYRDRFLYNAVHLSGDDFIDYKNNRAYLDSESFISVLELSARLDFDNKLDDDGSDEWDRLWNGTQLFTEEWFLTPDSLLRYQVIMDEFVAVGMPTNEGGQHVIQDTGGFSIYAGSEHKDAAWEFVRRFMLPGAEYDGLPIRIDMFEDLVDILKHHDIDGVMYFGSRQYKYPKLTDEAAVEIRKIIESASLQISYDSTVWMIISEDSEAFFTGNKNAAEAARIMQNRVQTYLNERG